MVWNVEGGAGVRAGACVAAASQHDRRIERGNTPSSLSGSFRLLLAVLDFLGGAFLDKAPLDAQTAIRKGFPAGIPVGSEARGGRVR